MQICLNRNSVRPKTQFSQGILDESQSNRVLQSRKLMILSRIILTMPYGQAGDGCLGPSVLPRARMCRRSPCLRRFLCLSPRILSAGVSEADSERVKRSKEPRLGLTRIPIHRPRRCYREDSWALQAPEAASASSAARRDTCSTSIRRAYP
jgi:hypothetical protein